MKNINTDDKKLIKAYVTWCRKKGILPEEYEISKFIDNMNCDHRQLVEDYITDLLLGIIK